MTPERKLMLRELSKLGAVRGDELAEALDALDAAERESEHRISMLQLVLDLPITADWKTIVERVASARTAEVKAEGDTALLAEYGIAREEYRRAFGVKTLAAAAQKEAAMDRIRARALALASGSGGNGGGKGGGET